MLLNQRKFVPATLALSSLLFICICASGQNTLNRPVASVTALDSNKDQDGLVGSVRRVQTESSRLEVKSGKLVEGQRQLLEITTYDLKGDRVDNISYPVAGASVGKEEYKYDEKGNIIEMTLRSNDGTIVSRETYTYEFDKIGNWVKMVSSLVLFEDGKLKSEPVEVTYRSIAYYFDDAIAKILDSTPASAASGASPAESKPQNIENDSAVESVRTELPVVKDATVAEKPAKEGAPPAASGLRVDGGIVVVASQPKPTEEPVAEERPETVSTAPPAVVPEESTPEPAESRTSLSLYEVGQNHLQEGKFREAVEAFQGYLKQEPTSAKGYLYLGYSYSKLKKRREAIRALKQAVSKNPHSEEAHYLLAVEYLGTRNFNEAVGSFKEALKVRPGMALAHYGLAIAYQELGKSDLVLKEYRTLQLLDSNLAQKLAATFPDLSLLPCRGVFCK
ncbi:MAG TPA: tetratricopeptide repeat protein [Pyrinomonadaceae bacterium]|nr:tetratricopeptide repeat protein [Pyrinomonadaceae bacterium]